MVCDLSKQRRRRAKRPASRNSYFLKANASKRCIMYQMADYCYILSGRDALRDVSTIQYVDLSVKWISVFAEMAEE